jgi:hypothetical protein
METHARYNLSTIVSYFLHCEVALIVANERTIASVEEWKELMQKGEHLVVLKLIAEMVQDVQSKTTAPVYGRLSGDYRAGLSCGD